MTTQDLDGPNQGWQPTRQELSEFLRGQITCTVSTVDPDGKPCGATVAFSEIHTGEFIIGTKQLSQKAHNLAGNPNVALTVVNEEKRYTVQLQGAAQPLTPDAFEPLSEPHYDKLPFLRAFKDDPEQIHFLITPSFLRFSDCSVYPWVSTEY